MATKKKASKPKSKAAQAKSKMKCGQVKKSNKPKKKVMKKVCKNGSEKMIYAGDSRYSSNKTPEQRKNYRKRHNCDKADPNKPEGLACNALWSKSSPSKTGTSPAKRKTAKTGKTKKAKKK